MRKIISTTCFVLGAGFVQLFVLQTFGAAPLEVYDLQSGRCLYQLKSSWLGFGESVEVPCGTYGQLAVQRVSETSL